MPDQEGKAKPLRTFSLDPREIAFPIFFLPSHTHQGAHY